MEEIVEVLRKRCQVAGIAKYLRSFQRCTFRITNVEAATRQKSEAVVNLDGCGQKLTLFQIFKTQRHRSGSSAFLVSHAISLLKLVRGG